MDWARTIRVSKIQCSFHLSSGKDWFYEYYRRLMRWNRPFLIYYIQLILTKITETAPYLTRKNLALFVGIYYIVIMTTKVKSKFLFVTL